MRSLMLSNPFSTSLDDATMREVVTPLLTATDLTSIFTQYAGHAGDICAQMTRADYDTVIVCGGDGTINEVLNGLLGDDPTHRPSPDRLPRVAVIPTGSANVFARALGFPNNPGHAAHKVAELLRNDSTRRLPLGFVDGRWFAVNVGFGLDAMVIDRMDALRKEGFSASLGAYALVAVKTWRSFKKNPPDISFSAITHNGTPVTGKHLPFVVVSNTNPWTYAGQVPIVLNPEQSLDAALSLYGLKEAEGLGGLGAFLHAFGVGRRIVKALRVDLREVRVDDSDDITLTSPSTVKWQADGEFEGEATELRVRSLPKVIDIVSPQINSKR